MKSFKCYKLNMKQGFLYPDQRKVLDVVLLSDAEEEVDQYEKAVDELGDKWNDALKEIKELKTNNKELIELLNDAKTTLEWVKENTKPDNDDYETFFNSITNSIEGISEHLNKINND